MAESKRKAREARDRLAPLFHDYVESINGENEEDEENFSDLLGDLMHFADMRGLNFDAALDRAHAHYIVEK